MKCYFVFVFIVILLIQVCLFYFYLHKQTPNTPETLTFQTNHAASPLKSLFDAGKKRNTESFYLRKGNNKLRDKEVYLQDILFNMLNISSLPVSNHHDLRYRPKQEVRDQYPSLFLDLPNKFSPTKKNPCWESSEGLMKCLPYVYILGQPKCGTSDLFTRLLLHVDVVGPLRKEVRWFTRGEFQTSALSVNQKINKETSIFDFTKSFTPLLKAFDLNNADNIQNLITVDGTPHNLWWSTQDPDGSVDETDIPVSVSCVVCV